MLRLAVATDAETLARMRDPLAARDIEAAHVRTAERTVALSAPPWDADAFDAGFVFPPRLAEGGVADALLSVPWVNDREAVLRSRHKAETLARLSQVGVPVPETVLVSNPAGEAALEEAFARFDPPVVVKPDSTTRGVGIAKVGDADSFAGVTDYLELIHEFPATGDRSFLVQEYLPDARDYRAMVVDGECVGGVERRLPDDGRAAGRWKHNVHRGARAEGVDLPADLRSLAEDAAAALDVPWLGVDILTTDGRAVVSETNARPTIDAATKYDDGFYDRLAALVRETARRD